MSVIISPPNAKLTYYDYQDYIIEQVSGVCCEYKITRRKTKSWQMPKSAEMLTGYIRNQD